MLSKTVSKKEATRSQTATRLGLDNSPTPEIMIAMEYVATHIVDAVRSKFGEAVDISSFFRSKELNKAVGGSETSQHCKGEAVDLDSRNDLLNLEIFNYIKDNMVVDQLIFEAPNAQGVPDWIHVSVCADPKKNRGQILVYLKSTRKYIPFGQYVKGMV